MRMRAAYALTDREFDVLRMLADGEGTRGIAQRLNYSERTVKNIVHDVLAKTELPHEGPGCGSRHAARGDLRRPGGVHEPQGCRHRPGLRRAAVSSLIAGEEELPNLGGLIDAGTWGPLRSVDPPITVPAWSCMMTGRDPGELGIYGFRNRSASRLSLDSRSPIPAL